jgi:hypothetical protein
VIDTTALNRLFPFMVRLDAQLTLLEVGRSLRSRVQFEPGDPLEKHFTVLRPFGSLSSQKVIRNQDRLTLLKVKASGLQLRGQLVYLDSRDEYLFVGSLKINSMADVEEHRLNIGDFAAHDPILDFLFLLNLSGSSSTEAQEVIDSLRVQTTLYKAALDKDTSYVFLINLDHRFIYQNNPFQLILGTVGIAQPALSGICTAESFSQVAKDIQGVINGYPRENYRLEVHRADGSVLPLVGSMKPFSVENLEPMAVGYFTEAPGAAPVNAHE